MQIVSKVFLVLLVLISLGAGVPKIIQMPQELGFLAHLGFSAIAVTLLGFMQFSGGILLLPQKTRLVGAVLVVISLLVSAIALLKGGSTGMGLISFLPVAIGLFVIVLNLPRKAKTNSDGQTHEGRA